MARVQQGQVVLEIPDSEVAYMESLGWVELDAQPAAPEDEFDPTAHTVEEVEAYLAGELPGEERERVLAAEANGKARKSILSKEGDVI